MIGLFPTIIRILRSLIKEYILEVKYTSVKKKRLGVLFITIVFTYVFTIYTHNRFTRLDYVDNVYDYQYKTDKIENVVDNDSDKDLLINSNDECDVRGMYERLYKMYDL